eukprot:8814224-Lingulodinium_polyedra.AAC.1
MLAKSSTAATGTSRMAFASRYTTQVVAGAFWRRAATFAAAQNAGVGPALSESPAREQPGAR